MVWNINPEIFSLDIFGFHLAPRWYGLLFATGILLGFQIMRRFFEEAGRSEDELNSGFMLFVIGTVLGARLGHCLFYEPEYYLSHPLKIFAFWEGGLASHGGVIGIFLCMLYFTRKHQISLIWLADRLALAISLGVPFIRIGNFFNSEIVGIPTDLPWGVVFSRSFDDNLPRHPAQLYEALSYFAIFFILSFWWKKSKDKIQPGQMIGAMLLGIFSARFLIEFIKIEQVDWERGMLLNMGQILSLPLIVIGVLLLANVQARFMTAPQPLSTKKQGKNSGQRRHS